MTDSEPTRAIDLRVEVPGTPEEVWEAIATGPGITAWFVPATVTEEGGERTLSLDFGAEFGTSTGPVTAYEPPHRMVHTSEMKGRTLAFEYLVEATDGGTCVVRLVNSGFGTEPDWDGEFHAMTAGWTLFLDVLRLYLTHFPGQHCSSIVVHGVAPGSQEEAFAAMAAALHIPAAGPGERVEVGGGDAPVLAGVVSDRTANKLTLRTDEPGGGLAFVYAEGAGDGAMTSVYAYLYGEDATATADRERPGWQAWMRKTFPMSQE